MSGKRTSVYLSADLAAAVERSGLPLAELIRRGHLRAARQACCGTPPPPGDTTTTRRCGTCRRRRECSGRRST